MANLLVIRADAGRGIGTGHVMRCLAVATAWRHRGGRAVLLSHRLPAALHDRVCEHRVEVIPIARRCPDPADRRETLAALETLRQQADETSHIGPAASRTTETNAHRSPAASPVPGAAWLLLDGYHFDTAYQRAVRGAGFHLAVIDDLNHLPRYEADVLVNYQAAADPLRYHVAGAGCLLTGPRFVLLRTEFADAVPAAASDPPVASNILVTLGGEDPANATPQMIEVLEQLDLPRFEARVILGPAARHREAIERLLDSIGRRQPAASPTGPNAPSGLPLRAPRVEQRWLLAPNKTIVLLHDVPQMAQLMRWAHVALSAAGTTCWELARLGTPTVMVSLADNQLHTGPALAEATGFSFLGSIEELSTEAIARHLESLCRDAKRRRIAGERASQLVDGKGADRVVEILRAVSGQPDVSLLDLRPVQPADCGPLWQLANDPGVRRNSLSRRPIPWEEHRAWFADRLVSPAAAIWVAEYCGLLVGSVRYELRERQAVVSVSVHPAFRSRGIGRLLVQRTWEAGLRRLGASRVIAQVRRENAASIRLFDTLGFRPLGPAVVHGARCVVFERRSSDVCCK